ncbi:hypothetical protein F5148DRAFT_614004 [Russula earlei]|uniref:Uncharacterized protein n=1 Tax=Russula earlei TaxID=71964 RepID=A0ACC0UGP7_9AGAM|nr:hypothetical protein F5148DRAFT_614004 [Russula earlei]
MEHLFLKLRLAAFSLTTFICLIWVILLSCVLFLRWEVSSQPERSFLFIFLGIDALTVIMLPILLIVKFRTWLDGARLLLLLTCHIGMATSFVFWISTIPCPDDAPDDRGVCQLLNVYIMIASWVPPFLLILYGAGLAIYAWRYASKPWRPLSIDEEAEGVQPRLQSDSVIEPRGSARIEHLSRLLSSLPSPGSHRESMRESRLGKRLPEHIFCGRL